MSWSVWFCAALGVADVRAAAATPLARSAATWSSISESSGEMTSANPAARSPNRSGGPCNPLEATTAGIWYVRLFPPPAGMRHSVSRPERTALMASRWQGRNAARPKVPVRAASTARSQAGNAPPQSRRARSAASRASRSRSSRSRAASSASARLRSAARARSRARRASTCERSASRRRRRAEPAGGGGPSSSTSSSSLLDRSSNTGAGPGPGAAMAPGSRAPTLTGRLA